MALLENRTGASVNPGNRQDNAQIVVFVADQAHDGSQYVAGMSEPAAPLTIR
jgi:hypothetical protein